MSRPARARVVGRFLLASRPTEATVEIDRGAGLFSVRPLRSRRVFTLPLALLAEICVQRIIRQEIAERKAARRKK